MCAVCRLNYPSSPKFNESANALAAFLNRMQTVLEPEDPNKSADESVIRERLVDLKEACRDLKHKQQDLDSLNDLGYRLSLNKNDADRIHVINNRYVE